MNQVLRDKILGTVESEVPQLTRRDQGIPKIEGKAIAAIGMRRSGKTTWLQQCRADLLEAGRSPARLVYINFEDERLVDLQARDLGMILDIHARLFPKRQDEPLVLFLDEIQRIPGWELFVRRLLDTPGHEVFLSGSSAKLLGREIATAMRGRAWEVEIHPFGFAEYLRHHGHEAPGDPEHLTSRRQAALDGLFASYLVVGGFPEAQGMSAAERRQLLQGYVDVVLLRDIIERHGVTSVTALRWLVRRLLGTPAGLFSVTRCAADMRSQGLRVGREVLHALLDHLEDACLLYAVPVATDSEKRRQVNPRKVYPADPGLIPVFDRSARANQGHALESAVFVELLRRRAEVAYCKTAAGYEVDFLAVHPDGARELIQVCSSIDDGATREREVRALLDAAEEHGDAALTLLTLESRTPFPEVAGPIRVLPAWQWMLKGDAG